MAIIDKGKCEIEYIGCNGMGVAKRPTHLISIPYTIEGEIVEFELHKYRNESNTMLKSVITASEDRITPICSYFGACGGCMLQHMNQNRYSKFKTNIIKNALNKYEIYTAIKDLISVPLSSRRRVFLKAIKKGTFLFLGFNRFRSNQIINIDKCPILIPELSNIIANIKKLLTAVLNDKEKASIGMTMANNGIDLLIESNNIDNSKFSILMDFAKKYTTRLQITSKNIITTIFEKETPYVIFGKHKINVNTKIFLQATIESDSILSNIVRANIEPNSAVVDLFCGLGTLSLPLTGVCLIDGFESTKEAIEILQKQNIPNTKFYNRDLYNKPLSEQELNKYQYAILNPPRSGAKKQCEKLMESNVKNIIYVSCNPETFARDAKILQKRYKLREVIPLDQFYYSPHIEVVGIFNYI